MELFVPQHLQGKLVDGVWTKMRPPTPPFLLKCFHKKVGGVPQLFRNVFAVEEAHDPGGGRGRKPGPCYFLRWSDGS